MRHQAVRTLALMLGVLVVAAPAARAGTITFGDLVRTVGASGQLRPASEVRLRFGARGGSPQAQNGPEQGGAASSQGQQPNAQQQTTQGGTATQTPASADPTLSQSGGRVETVDFGDVTGTVCDCGEIPAPPVRPGGFPWWPLLGGAVIPFLFPRDDDTPPNTPPGPTPTPPQIPEPMSLLLFGSGLLAVGAGARRRHGRRRSEEEALSATTAREV